MKEHDRYTYINRNPARKLGEYEMERKSCMAKSVAFLQPEVPHYRKEFFDRLKNHLNGMDIFVYNSIEKTKKQGFYVEGFGEEYIANINMKGILLYNPLKLLKRKYDMLVLMLQFSHLTTWLLLLTKWIHRKKIILWGQGISVKRYLQEEHKPDWKLKMMIALSDGVMFYTEKELGIWKNIFPDKKMVALNNTLTGAREMAEYVARKPKVELKEEYGIKEPVILIFCARFESNYRRTDLLLETIQRLDKDRFGFIIIGAGKNKPDFSSYANVYDFGAVYDTEKKQDLFSIADIYFQPGWVGLSIVEAMAYGKPVFTFKRSEETKQCVEYAYLQEDVNSKIFINSDDCIYKIDKVTEEEVCRMGCRAKQLVNNKLTLERMSGAALSIIENI